VTAAAAAAAWAVAAWSLLGRAGGPRSPVERALFPDAVARDPQHGAMAVTTALLILLLSASLAALSRARPGYAYAAQALALAALVGSLLALLDHLYGPHPPLIGNARSVIALHTAAGLTVAAAGALAAVPDGLARRVLERPGPGSAMRRRLLLLVAVVLPLVGWVRIEGERLGLYGQSFGVATIVLVAGALVYAAAWAATGTADRSGDMLRDAWHRLGSTNAGLERRVAAQAAELAEARSRLRGVLEVLGDAAPLVLTDADGRVAMASARALALLGRTEAELVGRRLATLDLEVRSTAAGRVHVLAETALDVTDTGVAADVTGALEPGRP
jgi:PAS domain-containing protein